MCPWCFLETSFKLTLCLNRDSSLSLWAITCKWSCTRAGGEMLQYWAWMLVRKTQVTGWRLAQLCVVLSRSEPNRSPTSWRRVRVAVLVQGLRHGDGLCQKGRCTMINKSLMSLYAKFITCITNFSLQTCCILCFKIESEVSYLRVCISFRDSQSLFLCLPGC